LKSIVKLAKLLVENNIDVYLFCDWCHEQYLLGKPLNEGITDWFRNLGGKIKGAVGGWQNTAQQQTQQQGWQQHQQGQDAAINNAIQALQTVQQKIPVFGKNNEFARAIAKLVHNFKNYSNLDTAGAGERPMAPASLPQSGKGGRNWNNSQPTAPEGSQSAATWETAPKQAPQTTPETPATYAGIPETPGTYGVAGNEPPRPTPMRHLRQPWYKKA